MACNRIGLMAIAILFTAVLMQSIHGQRANATAQPPAVAPLKAGFLSLSEFMKGSKKWRSQATVMAKKRQVGMQNISEMQLKLQQLQTKLKLTADSAEQAGLQKEIQEKIKEIDTTTKNVQVELDTQSNAILLQFKIDFSKELDQLARERGFDTILSYPGREGHGMTPQEAKSSMGMELFFRSSALMPLMLREELDVTCEMIARFDANFDPDVKPAGHESK